MTLKDHVRNAIQAVLGRTGFQVIRREALARLRRSMENEKSLEQAIALIREMPLSNAPLILEHMRKSRSQLAQDLFVLCKTGFKRNGFFVEFGAANGIDLSNTYLLETEFGWRGILAEPARRWQADLRSHRSATLDFDCVWSRSGETLSFNETDVGEFSTLDTFTSSDGHHRKRAGGKRYDVRTVSLSDLLSRHRAPTSIDYLSIDTEGSEYEILSAFDFDTYRIDVITVEHNFTPTRDRIHGLLTSKQYERVCTDLSAFDDWYVRR